MRDQGSGSAPEDQARLFTRFFRSEANGRRGDSTGLGLSIAKAAGESHGGHLEFIGNNPSAVFRLVLPSGITQSCGAWPGRYRSEPPQAAAPTGSVHGLPCGAVYLCGVGRRGAGAGNRASNRACWSGVRIARARS